MPRTKAETVEDTPQRLDPSRPSTESAEHRCAGEKSTRKASLGSLVSRARLAVMGLPTVGCVEVRATEPDRQSGLAVWALFALLLIGGAAFLIASRFLMNLTHRRHRRRTGKILMASIAALGCGALSVALVYPVVAAARGGAVARSAALGLGLVVTFGSAVFLSRRGSLRAVARRAAMTVGFHSLALPIGMLVSFLVKGAYWGVAEPGRELTAVVLGVRLAGEPSAIGLSVGGLLVGVGLVFIGDRLRRGANRRVRILTPPDWGAQGHTRMDPTAPPSKAGVGGGTGGVL